LKFLNFANGSEKYTGNNCTFDVEVRNVEAMSLEYLKENELNRLLK